jgi:hypothetical protein
MCIYIYVPMYVNCIINIYVGLLLVAAISSGVPMLIIYVTLLDSNILCTVDLPTPKVYITFPNNFIFFLPYPYCFYFCFSGSKQFCSIYRHRYATLHIYIYIYSSKSRVSLSLSLSLSLYRKKNTSLIIEAKKCRIIIWISWKLDASIYLIFCHNWFHWFHS